MTGRIAPSIRLRRRSSSSRAMLPAEEIFPQEMALSFTEESELCDFLVSYNYAGLRRRRNRRVPTAERISIEEIGLSPELADKLILGARRKIRTRRPAFEDFGIDTRIVVPTNGRLPGVLAFCRRNPSDRYVARVEVCWNLSGEAKLIITTHGSYSAKRIEAALGELRRDFLYYLISS